MHVVTFARTKKKEMHILWVSPHCWPDYILRSPGLGIKSQGGQTVVMYHCPRALAEVNPDLQVDIYARMETGEPEVIQLGKRVRLIRCLCGNPDTYVPKEQFWGGPIQQFVDEVDKYTGEYSLSYDLIHGHYADGWYVAHHLGQRWNIPYCLTTHSLGKRKLANCMAMKEGTRDELDEKYSFSVRIQHETKALHDANRICPLTEEEGQYILEHYEGVRPEQLCTIPNGILLTDFYPHIKDQTVTLRRELGIEEDELVVLQAGRVDRRKGQKELLTAAPKVIEEVEKRTGKRVKFILVGWTESDFARIIEERIRNADITDRVIFHPPVSNRGMPPYFWMADVYALTSTYDIFPIVILEAMASSLAVASRNGGASEIISHGHDGLLVDPYQIREVEEALISVLVDRKLRCSLGEKAHRKVEEHYTWRCVVERLNQLYEKMVRENRK